MARKRRSFEEQRRFEQQQDYDTYNTRQFKLKLNKRTDEDIIRWAEAKMGWRSETSFQAEVKRLIRKEIEAESKNKDNLKKQD